MSRNSGGTYTLPLSAVVAGNAIEASWANTTLDDIATELTDSLSRSGKGGLSASIASDVGATGTFNPEGAPSAGDNAAFGYSATLGAILTGQGSTNDVTIRNDAASTVMSIPTGTVNVNFAGDVGVAGTLNPTGDPAAGDPAAVGYTATEGLILTGQGSTNDVTIKNDADAAVMSIPTGTTRAVFAGKVQPGGDTAAADAAAIGYTATEGLILTGQGSTNDVTIKNDADADVATIATGTTVFDMVGAAIGGQRIYPRTSFAVVTCSLNTAEEFTGIPSWATKITVLLELLSISGSNNPVIELGDSGGYEDTGYNGEIFRSTTTNVNLENKTNGIWLQDSTGAGDTLTGRVVIELLDPATFTWVWSGLISEDPAGRFMGISGAKSLSAALDRIQVTTTGGSQTLDGGKIKVYYE